MVSKAKPASKRRTRTPPHPSYPEWSSAKFWGFVRSALRSAGNKWPPKYQVLNKAKSSYSGPNKLQKWEYTCAECENKFKAKEVSVDHIVPCGTLTDYQDLAGFVERLFVAEEGLQVLCKTCHDFKSKQERQLKQQG